MSASAVNPLNYATPVDDAFGFFVTVVTAKGATTKRIEGDLLSVGRGEDCNLRVTHDSLSRRHLSIQLRNNQCFVEDHGSTHGTFVNGKRITPHVPLRVMPEDHIQLGQSGVRISASTEPQMWKQVAPPVPGSPKLETIVTSTVSERRLQRDQQSRFEPRPPDQAQEQAAKLVNEAQKRVAEMIRDAELEAEQRVQDIYRRAHETQSKTDEVYQKRLNEAYRSAELTYQKSLKESESLLTEARRKSAEIRAQAESFVMELRKRTEEDCERILEEAQFTARELKESRLVEAEESIAAKEAEVIHQAQENMNQRLARFEDDLRKEAQRHREQLEQELKDRRAELARETQSLNDLRTQVQKVTHDFDRLTTQVEQRREQMKAVQDEAAQNQIQLETLKRTQTDLKDEIKQLTRARDEGRVAVEKVRSVQEGIDQELTKMRAKFEESKAKLIKDEQSTFEQLRLETTHKVQRLEEKWMEELAEKKDRLTRELSLSLESYLKQNPNPKSGTLHAPLAKVFESQVYSLSKDPTTKAKLKNITALKRREKWQAILTGVAIGLILVVGGQSLHQVIKANQAPLQKRMALAAEEQRKDLERRKFNPMQTSELRPSYTDSVLYTQNYVTTYTSDEFQKTLLQYLTPFMLRTWRVEEDKVIQAMAASTALVKELAARKDAIHPDFIPQGIEKMRDLENESMQRLKSILGSQVRVESFRRYERKFYESTAAKREARKLSQ